MTIYGFYTDESGNNGYNDIQSQPVLFYGGLLVPINIQVELNREIGNILSSLLNDIKMNVRGIPGPEYKSIPFFRDFELHGKEFVDGDNFYGNLKPNARFDYIKRMLELIVKHDIKLVGSVVNKVEYQQSSKSSNHNVMHIFGYSNLVELINIEIEKTDSYAFVICDDGKSTEISNFYSALLNPKNSRVYPDLQLKVSHDSHCNLIQLADVVVFISCVYFRREFGFAARKKYQAELDQLFLEYLKNRFSLNVQM